MRVLIVVEDPILGAVLRVVVGGYATGVQIALVSMGQRVFQVRDENSKPLHILETIESVGMVIVSHSNHDAVSWIQRLAENYNKTFLCVLAESTAIPVSAITLDLFKDMWPQIAAAAKARAEKKT